MYLRFFDKTKPVGKNRKKVCWRTGDSERRDRRDSRCRGEILELKTEVDGPKNWWRGLRQVLDGLHSGVQESFNLNSKPITDFSR